jgi:2-polyprenyl-3-methyl-5-hydroxy-6-metoxy-1,4-benzoquinol methylase
MIHHKKCPLCSSEKLSSDFRGTDHYISKEEFEVFKCEDCSFLFTQDYPEESEIERFYESEEYISHSDKASGFTDKLYHKARNLMLQKKRRIVNNFSGLESGSLLDIGSGTGYFANEMKKAGWQVSGIEMNKKAREFSVTQFGLDVISPGQISTLKTDSFDCITLWHVLEHLHDPFAYTTEIRRLLKPGGRCIIAMPNCGSYDAKYYSRYWAAYDVPRHLWHFNPETFRFFAEKTGFKITEIRNLPLDVFYISFLSEKYKGSALPFVKAMIKGLWFSAKALFKKERSSSLIYILKKKSL